MSAQEWPGDDPDAMNPPIVVAPFIFWSELQDRTSGCETTVESLAWWVRKNPSHYVKVTGHLIEVGIVDSSPADRYSLLVPAEGAPRAVRGPARVQMGSTREW